MNLYKTNPALPRSGQSLPKHPGGLVRFIVCINLIDFVVRALTENDGFSIEKGWIFDRK